MQQVGGAQQGPLALAAMQQPRETVVLPNVLPRQSQQQTQQPQQWMVQTPWGPELLRSPVQQTAQNEAMQVAQQMQPQSMPQLLPQSPQASVALPPGALPFTAARQFGGEATVIQGQAMPQMSGNLQVLQQTLPQAEAMPGNIQMLQQTLPQMSLSPTLPQALPQAFVQNQEPSFSPWTGTEVQRPMPMLQPGLAPLQNSLPGQYINALPYQVR